MNFTDKLKQALEQNDSCLCVGLDPDIRRIPDSLKQKHADPSELVRSFLKQVIDATRGHCCAYKPNLGFFEALGRDGLDVFGDILDYIPNTHITIADAKRGDISSTADHYAKAYFEVFDVDALTVNPLMGFESLNPFLDYPGKALYCLTLTSNPGAGDFLMQTSGASGSLAAAIAGGLSALQDTHPTHLGMVVGATRADDAQSIIRNHPGGSLLIPGIGTQGGSVSGLQKAIKGHMGVPLINSSRSILYAGEGEQNWLESVEKRASELKNLLHPITLSYV